LSTFAVPSRVAISPTLEHSLREAEASSFAEGIDPANDLEYQALKRRLLAGEITVDEAVALYIEKIPRAASVSA
jgi:hypothetical protein